MQRYLLVKIAVALSCCLLFIKPVKGQSMYTCTNSSGYGAIYRFDLSTCTSTLIMPTTQADASASPVFYDIAIFSGDPSHIYGITGDAKLYKVNVSDGAITLINNAFSTLYPGKLINSLVFL